MWKQAALRAERFDYERIVSAHQTHYGKILKKVAICFFGFRLLFFGENDILNKKVPRKMMVVNESQEMYLETILKLQKTKGSVRSIDVAEALGYSKPSVSRAVGIMKKDGFIIVRKDGEIDLTDSGKAKAENVLERHRALTAALIKMGLAEEAAEENACRVEHVITEEAFEAIKKYFGV